MTKFKVGNICRIGGCIKMGKNKPRTAVNRRVNKWLENLQSGRSAEGTPLCEWWDGGYPECMLPWSHKTDENGCNGNPFICKKLYYKYLASVDKPSQDIIDEFNRRKNEQ